MNHSIQDPTKAQSWQMFNRIAKTYDSVNKLLSFGLDKGWRKKVGQLLPNKENLHLLDLATGTADQVISLVKQHPNTIRKAVGMDLSEGMLDVGRKKITEQNLKEIITLQAGDAVNIPAENSCFDAVTISFGIRNVPNVPSSLTEMHRILTTGGKALILEFSMPANPVVRWGHLFYLRHILPLVGGLVSGDRAAYRYLNTSIESFPYGDDFCLLLKDAGFTTVKAHPVTFGIATIYEAIR
jgi:demethylmenaquinone methyltransferase / 2-methoxy-6-polyprenyl-1,4-benzoquinol methylase